MTPQEIGKRLDMRNIQGWRDLTCRIAFCTYWASQMAFAVLSLLYFAFSYLLFSQHQEENRRREETALRAEVLRLRLDVDALREENECDL